MVGHDAPNALTQATRALIDEITQRKQTISAYDAELNKLMLDRATGENARLRQELEKARRLAEQLLAELEALREPRKS